jgi:hypothetical protein
MQIESIGVSAVGRRQGNEQAPLQFGTQGIPAKGEHMYGIRYLVAPAADCAVRPGSASRAITTTTHATRAAAQAHPSALQCRGNLPPSAEQDTPACELTGRRSFR